MYENQTRVYSWLAMGMQQDTISFFFYLRTFKQKKKNHESRKYMKV